MEHSLSEAPEITLIEALKKVDLFGDIAPPHVHDPMTALLRQKALLGSLIRWDDTRGQYVLTGTGRSRITARNRATATVLRFRTREGEAARTPLRKT